MTWPQDFGNTAGEYLAAHDGAAYAGQQSGLAWAVGPDAVSFLQGIVTQDVESMKPGSVARSLLLEPRGKLDATMWLLRDSERVGLVTHVSELESMVASLTRWRIRVDVDFELDSRTAFDLIGPAVALGPESGWADDGNHLVAVLGADRFPRRLAVGYGQAELSDLGMTPIGESALTAVRIESGEPLMNVDIDAKTIPQESGLVPQSVSFTKGCYLGQELVARIDTRGRVNRHLRGVRMHSEVIPPVGAEVRHGDASVGTLSSVGESLALKAPIALGLIRREAEPGTVVDIAWDGGSTAGTVEALPMLGE